MHAGIPVHYWSGGSEFCGPQRVSVGVTLKKTAVQMAVVLTGPGFPIPHVLDYNKVNATIGWTDSMHAQTLCSGLR
jgi:hypothetical protein